jgi:hypothetical protein
VVLVSRATERTGGHGASWTGTDGYEISSQLMTIEEARQAASGDPASRVYLPLLTT